MKGIETLRENERLVVSLYYYENLMLKDIASILNVTISRVSHIHSRALKKLQVYLQEINYIEVA